MRVIQRPYNRNLDFDSVGHFLVRTYGAGTPHRNWAQPRWEYMHFSVIDTEHLDHCQVWEDRGTIVGRWSRFGPVFGKEGPGGAARTPNRRPDRHPIEVERFPRQPTHLGVIYITREFEPVNPETTGLCPRPGRTANQLKLEPT